MYKKTSRLSELKGEADTYLYAWMRAGKHQRPGDCVEDIPKLYIYMRPSYIYAVLIRPLFFFKPVCSCPSSVAGFIYSPVHRLSYSPVDGLYVDMFFYIRYIFTSCIYAFAPTVSSRFRFPRRAACQMRITAIALLSLTLQVRCNA